MSKDVTEMTREELNALIGAAQQQLVALDAQEQLDEEEIRRRISGAVSSLTALLGSPDDPPYDPAVPGAVANIRSVSKHSQAVLEQNTGLVLALLLEGLEIITVNSINIALLVDAD
jgi:hypothetical protein